MKIRKHLEVNNTHRKFVDSAKTAFRGKLTVSKNTYMKKC